MPIENPLEALPSGVMQALQVANQISNERYRRDQDQQDRARQARLDQLKQDQDRRDFDQRANEQRLKEREFGLGLEDKYGATRVDNAGYAPARVEVPSLIAGANGGFTEGPSFGQDTSRPADNTFTLPTAGITYQIPHGADAARYKASTARNTALAKQAADEVNYVDMPKDLVEYYGNRKVDPDRLAPMYAAVDEIIKQRNTPNKGLTVHSTSRVTDDRTGKVYNLTTFSDGSTKRELIPEASDLSHSDRAADRAERAGKKDPGEIFAQGLEKLGVKAQRDFDAVYAKEQAEWAKVAKYQKQLNDFYNAPKKDESTRKQLALLPGLIAEAKKNAESLGEQKQAFLERKENYYAQARQVRGGDTPAPAEQPAPAAPGPVSAVRPAAQVGTNLSPAQEQAFMQWKAKVAPLDSGEDYDLRAAFLDKQKPSDNGHLNDKFKLPNHPTFSTGSLRSTKANPGGRWAKENGKNVFYASPANLKEFSPEELKDYFAREEPDSILVLPGESAASAAAPPKNPYRPAIGPVR